ncbi:hypothetical protein [Streptomyces sp. NPDC002133]|uniref:hypothetical protein n=1 Tax=Streptomyces sp. NPDC002133 TaxID=3154409 RepID=UPI00332BCF5B
MNTFLTYLVIVGMLVFVGLPSLIGYARDRAIDRGLREAEHRDAERAGARTVTRSGPPPACVRQNRQKSASRSTEPSTAT